MQNNPLQLEQAIADILRTIYDPEIPVNIFDLGLIYEVEVNDEKSVVIEMTLTAPNCPVADDILLEVKEKVEGIEGVKSCTVNLVFDPPWSKEMMTEEAMLELGLL